MPIEQCWSATYTGGCRCYDVTGSTTFWIHPDEGLWLTFVAWNHVSRLMSFAYTINNTPEDAEENTNPSTLTNATNDPLYLLC